MTDFEEKKHTINWFPGHMSKTRRLISENLRLCDLACEVVDARIARASRNPVLDELLGGKARIVVLNKSDLADPAVNARWQEHFRRAGILSVLCNSKTKQTAQEFMKACRTAGADILEKRGARGIVTGRLRVMVTGIPNVGKSTFINMLAGRRAAAAQDRPGVTRGKQWVNVGDGSALELLDTPGILWPKIETEQQALLLSFTGAIKDTVLDTEYVAQNLARVIAGEYPDALEKRYKITDFAELAGHELLEKIGRARGFVRKGAEVDTERAGLILLDEYRAGGLGRMSFEVPEDA